MSLAVELVILASIGGLGYLLYQLRKLNSFSKEEEYSEEGYIVLGYPDRYAKYASADYENEEE